MNNEQKLREAIRRMIKDELTNEAYDQMYINNAQKYKREMEKSFQSYTQLIGKLDSNATVALAKSWGTFQKACDKAYKAAEKSDSAQRFK